MRLKTGEVAPQANEFVDDGWITISEPRMNDMSSDYGIR